jgi:hypothetical protein
LYDRAKKINIGVVFKYSYNRKQVNISSLGKKREKNPSQLYIIFATLVICLNENLFYGNREDVPLLMTALRKCGIYTQ